MFAVNVRLFGREILDVTIGTPEPEPDALPEPTYGGFGFGSSLAASEIAEPTAPETYVI